MVNKVGQVTAKILFEKYPSNSKKFKIWQTRYSQNKFCISFIKSRQYKVGITIKCEIKNLVFFF